MQARKFEKERGCFAFSVYWIPRGYERYVQTIETAARQNENNKTRHKTAVPKDETLSFGAAVLFASTWDAVVGGGTLTRLENG